MNPMRLKTPEERRAIAAKGLVTRRRNREVREALRRDAQDRIYGLKDEIEKLERYRDSLITHKIANIESYKLDGKTLLREQQIVEASTSWKHVVGVYFLIKDSTVVYIGQSVNVFSRIDDHSKEKDFDAIAYVQCDCDNLDKLESLYIHVLQPSMNGNMRNGAKCAPIAINDILRG